MTDLQSIIPGFPSNNVTAVLERNLITTTDLLVCDALEIAKRTGLGVLDVREFVGRVRGALMEGVGVISSADGNMEDVEEESISRTEEEKKRNTGKEKSKRKLVNNGEELVEQWEMISTLDKRIDGALGGGIPVGYITEITGESGAGKTQLLLSLLLSAQLPPPHGLSRPTLYISTESALPTTRLRQMLSSNPAFSDIQNSSNANFKVSLDNIHSIVTPDLESQDHILRYQVPIFVERCGIGLIVLDSVAANYRAEFDRGGGGGANMAKRSQELMRLGELFRELASKVGCAVVVANQVADRFSTSGSGFGAGRSGGESGRKRKRDSGEGWARATQSSPLAYHRKGNDGDMIAGTANTHITSTPMMDPPSSMIAAAELGLPHPGISFPQSSNFSQSPTPNQPTNQTRLKNQPETPNPNITSHPVTHIFPSHLKNRDILSLDHQQRFFTGWGDVPPSWFLKYSSQGVSGEEGEGEEENMKTPSLGLVWSTQVACRVVLRKKAIYGDAEVGGGDGKDGDDGDGEDRGRVLKGWRRWLRVVFAPWVKGGDAGIGMGEGEVDGNVEYVIGVEGVRSVVGTADDE